MILQNTMFFYDKVLTADKTFSYTQKTSMAKELKDNTTGPGTGFRFLLLHKLASYKQLGQKRQDKEGSHATNLKKLCSP